MRDNNVDTWWRWAELAAVLSIGLQENVEGQFLGLFRKDSEWQAKRLWTPYILAAWMASVIYDLWKQHPDMYSEVDVPVPQQRRPPLTKTGPMRSMVFLLPGQSTVAPMPEGPIMDIKGDIQGR